VEAGGGVGHPFWKRISNSIHYQSPVMGGAQVKVAYQTNQDKAVTGVIADPQMWSASVSWSGMGGRLRVGAAYDAHKDFTSAGNTDDGFRITGGWNFGFMDIGAAYEQMTYKTAVSDCDATQWGVALAVPIGQGAIRASYSQADDIEGTYSGAGTFAAGSSCGAVGAGDNGAKQWNIGYDYRFSKRTTVGVGYATIENDAAAVFTWSGLSSSQGGQSINPVPGSDVSIFFVNMVHRF
jgi:predicted porin